MRAHKIAVAFFKTEQIGMLARLLILLDLFAYKLKAGKHLHGLHSVALRNGAGKLACNYGFYEYPVFRQSTRFFFCL